MIIIYLELITFSLIGTATIIFLIKQVRENEEKYIEEKKERLKIEIKMKEAFIEHCNMRNLTVSRDVVTKQLEDLKEELKKYE